MSETWKPDWQLDEERQQPKREQESQVQKKKSDKREVSNA